MAYIFKNVIAKAVSIVADAEVFPMEKHRGSVFCTPKFEAASFIFRFEGKKRFE